MSLGQLGLVGMEERVRALNGRLAVTDLPDGGVCVRVLLPGMRKDTRIQEREEA
jgi:signal transduction histidine kinase